MSVSNTAERRLPETDVTSMTTATTGGGRLPKMTKEQVHRKKRSAHYSGSKLRQSHDNSSDTTQTSNDRENNSRKYSHNINPRNERPHRIDEHSDSNHNR
eukprot:UN06083